MAGRVAFGQRNCSITTLVCTAVRGKYSNASRRRASSCACWSGTIGQRPMVWYLLACLSTKGFEARDTSPKQKIDIFSKWSSASFREVLRKNGLGRSEAQGAQGQHAGREPRDPLGRRARSAHCRAPPGDRARAG